MRNSRRTTAAAWTAATLGLSLTLAGALAPADNAPSTVAGQASLQQLLNPSGIARINPAEEMAAQQALGARHYGALGLSRPQALSAAIQGGVEQASRVRASSRYGHRWDLRGPVRYFANDPQRSGDLTKLGFHNLSGRVTSIATTPTRPGLVWLATAGGGVWRSTDQGHHWKPRFDRQGTLAIGSIAIDPKNPDRSCLDGRRSRTVADPGRGAGTGRHRARRGAGAEPAAAAQPLRDLADQPG